MVEIDGERNLAPSCTRQVSAGMRVHSDTSERALNSRRLVIELLLSEQPPRAQAHDRNAPFWHWAEQLGLQDSRFPPRAAMAGAAPAPLPDRSHPAMSVQLDACIHCQLCVQACRDIQANDVIGMAGRGAAAKIVFDLDDAMGDSSCVGCGECVQACPNRRADGDDDADRRRQRPARDGGVGRPRRAQHLPLLRRRLPDRLSGAQGADRRRHWPQWSGQPRAPVRQGPLRLRLRALAAALADAADPP
jgi:formate dehydrogenase major subunit